MCDRVTGECTQGCANPASFGAYCTETCPVGLYGDDCSQACSCHCLYPASCSPVNGECTGGCKAGYKPPLCVEPCDDRHYGVDCSLTCGDCKDGAACDHVTGECDEGCAPPRTVPCAGDSHLSDSSCQEEMVPPKCLCPAGKWGPPPCDEGCSGCVEGFICNAEDGVCMEDPLDVYNNAKAAASQVCLVMMICVLNEDVQRRKRHIKSRINLSHRLVKRQASNDYEYESEDDENYDDYTPEVLSHDAPMLSYDAPIPHDAPKALPPFLLSQPEPPVSINPEHLYVQYGNTTFRVPTAEELAQYVPDPAVQAAIRDVFAIAAGKRNKTLQHMQLEDYIDPFFSACQDPEMQSPNCKCLLGFYGDACNKECGHCLGVQCMQRDGNCLGECESGYMMPDCQRKCPAGYYGDCYTPCGQCEEDLPCEHIDGKCTSGCKTGFKPPTCETCVEGMYGPGCNYKCGSCLSGECDPRTGYCEGGCAQGKEPPFCKCRNFFFGENCTEPCGNCRDGVGCDPHTGMCLYGCQAGYTGLHCNENCPEGSFGEDCSQECGHCDNNTICHPIDGSCPNQRCSADYRLPQCKCRKKQYGEQCLPCGNCMNGVDCDINTGQCYQCQFGYRMPMCKCEFYQWGDDCKVCGHCASHPDICDIDTGKCLAGCNAGYRGDQCHDKCEPGFYGKDCAEICGSCYDCLPCDPLSGECKMGCKPGFWEPFCQEQCLDGLWGFDCQSACGHCKDGEICRKSDGKCLSGCDKGRKPPLCESKCDPGTYGSNCLEKCGKCKIKTTPCNFLTGYCPRRQCENGYEGMQCKYLSGEEIAEALKLCPAFTYRVGKNCERCGYCYNSTMCSPVTGLCEVGCEPGYRPMYCKTKCAYGKYGANCQHECGHCANASEICRVTDGFCLSGCAKGYYGKTCHLEVGVLYPRFRSHANDKTEFNLVLFAFIVALFFDVI